MINGFVSPKISSSYELLFRINHLTQPLRSIPITGTSSLVRLFYPAYVVARCRRGEEVKQLHRFNLQGSCSRLGPSSHCSKAVQYLRNLKGIQRLQEWQDNRTLTMG